MLTLFDVSIEDERVYGILCSVVVFPGKGATEFHWTFCMKWGYHV